MKYLSWLFLIHFLLGSPSLLAADLDDLSFQSDELDVVKSTYQGEALTLEDINDIPMILLDESGNLLRDQAKENYLNQFQPKGPLELEQKNNWELLIEVQIHEASTVLKRQKYNRDARADDTESAAKHRIGSEAFAKRLGLFAYQARAVLSFEEKVLAFASTFSTYYYNNHDSRSDILEMETRLREDVNQDGEVAIIPQGVCGNEQKEPELAAEWEEFCLKAQELLSDIDDSLDPNWLLNDFIGDEPMFDAFLAILPELWFLNPEIRPGLEFLMRAVDANYFTSFQKGFREARGSWAYQGAQGFVMGMGILGIASFYHPQGSKGVIISSKNGIKNIGPWISNLFPKKPNPLVTKVKEQPLLLTHQPGVRNQTPLQRGTTISSAHRPSKVRNLGPEDFRKDSINAARLKEVRASQTENLTQALRQRYDNERAIWKYLANAPAHEKVDHRYLTAARNFLRRVHGRVAIGGQRGSQTFNSQTKTWSDVASKPKQLAQQMFNAAFTRRAESLQDWQARRHAIYSYLGFSVGYGTIQATAMWAGYETGFFQQLDKSPSQILSDNLYGLAILQNQCRVQEILDRVSDAENYDNTNLARISSDRTKLKELFDEWSFLSRTAKELERAAPVHYKRFNNNPVAYTEDLEFRKDWRTTEEQESGMEMGVNVSLKNQKSLGEFPCPMLIGRTEKDFQENPEKPPIIISIDATKDLLKYAAILLIEAEGQGNLERVDQHYERLVEKINNLQETVAKENKELEARIKAAAEQEAKEKAESAEDDEASEEETKTEDDEQEEIEEEKPEVDPYEWMNKVGQSKFIDLFNLHIDDKDVLKQVLGISGTDTFLKVKNFITIDVYEDADIDRYIEEYLKELDADIAGGSLAEGNMSYYAEETHNLLPPTIYNDWVLKQIGFYLATPREHVMKGYRLAVLITLSDELRKQKAKESPEVKLLDFRMDPMEVLYYYFQETREN